MIYDDVAARTTVPDIGGNQASIGIVVTGW